MPVLYSTENIPARILYRLVKANLLSPAENIEMLPVNQFLGFLLLPDEGFFVTRTKLVLYETRVLIGLSKVKTFDLDRVQNITFTKENSCTIFIVMQNGEQYSVETRLKACECTEVLAKIQQLSILIT